VFNRNNELQNLYNTAPFKYTAVIACKKSRDDSSRDFLHAITADETHH